MHIAMSDENGDGHVDKEEFMLAARDMMNEQGSISKSARRWVYKYAEGLYEVADMDNDGVLNEREMEYASYLSRSALEMAEKMKKSLDELDDHDFGLAAAKELLQGIDKNRDGRIDPDEFLSAGRHDFMVWGWTDENFDRPEVRNWFAETFGRADVDKDGFLGDREVQYAGFLVYRLAINERARTLVYLLDRDGDGLVERWEIQEILDEGWERADGGKTVLHHIHDEFDKADTDGSGFLDHGEMLPLAADSLGA